LPEKSKELWRLLAPDLIATDRLRTEDVPLFEMLCVAYNFALFSFATATKEGVITRDAAHKDTPRKHPAFQAWKESVKTLKELAVEFGLTPSSRMRLQLPAGTDDPENPWTKY
jgi:P27 family predicted phage terminase small subunit